MPQDLPAEAGHVRGAEAEPGGGPALVLERGAGGSPSVKQETKRALSLSEPGPHAFLILVPVCEFTEVERRIPGELENIFGKGALRHALVLLTSGDYLIGKEVEEYLAGEDPGLRQVVDQCGGRYHVFNNRRPQERSQVRTLLDKVRSSLMKSVDDVHDDAH